MLMIGPDHIPDSASSVDEKFDADYFLNGPSTGKSNYCDYHWMGDVTLAYAIYLRRHLGIKDGESVLDVGAARGYLVKALRMAGLPATGYDISRWAVENCDPDVRGFVSNELSANPMSVDWIHMKDVAEHIQERDLLEMLPRLYRASRRGCFFIVPLAEPCGGDYIYPPDNMDSTHVMKLGMISWMRLFKGVADAIESETTELFTVSASLHMHGLKRASVEYPGSTGFFTIKRV